MKKLASRFGTLDAVLLLSFGLSWLAAFALYLPKVWHEDLARVPLHISAPESPDGYPTIRGFRTGTEQEVAGLSVGAELVRIRDISLRGVGPLGFLACVYEAAAHDLRIPVTLRFAGQERTAVFHLSRQYYPLATVPLTLGFATMGRSPSCERRGHG